MLITSLILTFTAQAQAETTFTVAISCSPDIEKMRANPIGDIVDGDFATFTALAKANSDGLLVLDNPTRSDALAALNDIGARGEVYDTIVFTAVGVGFGSDLLNPSIACRDFNVDDESTWLTATDVAGMLKGKAKRYVSLLDVSRDRAAALEVDGTFGPNADNWILGADNYVMSASAPGRTNADGFLQALTTVLASKDTLSVGEFEKRMRITGIGIDTSLAMHSKGLGTFLDRNTALWTPKPPAIIATDTPNRKSVTLTPRAVAWSAGAASLVGAGITGGMLYGMYTELKVDELPSKSEDAWEAEYTRYTTLRTTTVALASFAVVAGLTGIILEPKKTSITTVTIAPTPFGVTALATW